MRAGRRKTEGKRAGEDPHPKAELRRQLAAVAERRGAVATATKMRQQWRWRLGHRGQQAAAAGLMGSRARGNVL
jgi:hypothetical protein